MNQIIWKDAVAGTESVSVDLGLAYVVFKGCQKFVVSKVGGPKAVIMFKDKATNKVATVIMQNQVSDDFKAGKFTVAQALSFPVVRMEKLTIFKRDASGVLIKDAEGKLVVDRTIDEPTMWLGKPGQGWSDVVEDLVQVVTDYEELAV